MDPKSNHTIYRLNPREDLSNDPTYMVYQGLLEEINADKQIHNVALIGERGTGKSSILRTFDRECKGKAQENSPYEGMLFVSLIDFEDRDAAETENGEDQEKEASREDTQKRLECSVLRQILVRCTGKDLKNSRLRSVVPTEPRRLNRWSFLGILAWLLICGLIFGLLFEERFGVVLRLLKRPELERAGLHALGYVLLFAALFAVGTYCWFARTYPLRLGKLTIKHGNAEAELLTLEQKHCLDEYKFEIIHILDRLAPRIGHMVVFEDMERLESGMCLEIMTKLRELNDLLNTYRQGRDRNAEPIRFVYALDDKVFTCENRIKFFDVVLPLVPTLNRASFTERFCIALGEVTKVYPGSKVRELIEGLNVCMFDYRLMLSAINEYKILSWMYFAHKNERTPQYEVEEADDACILAIALYKTLCPVEARDLFLGSAAEPFVQPDEKTAPHQAKLYRYLMDCGYLSKEVLKWILYPYGEIAGDWEKQLTRGTWGARIRVAHTMCAGDYSVFRSDIRFRKIFETAEDPELARVLGKVVFREPEDILGRIRELCEAGEAWDQVRFMCYLAGLYRHLDTIPDQLSAEDRELLQSWCAKQLQEELKIPDCSGWEEDWNARWQGGLGLTAAACLSGARNAVPGDRQLGEKSLTQWFEVLDNRRAQDPAEPDEGSGEAEEACDQNERQNKFCDRLRKAGADLRTGLGKLLGRFRKS